MIGGHGHVIPLPDGLKARCGGPAICAECATEEKRVGERRQNAAGEWPDALYDRRTGSDRRGQDSVTAGRIQQILHVGCGRKKYSAEQLLAYVGLSLGDEATDAGVIHLDADEYLQPDIRCRLGDEEIPLESNSVDLVIAWHVLEHVGKQGEMCDWFFAWEELYRVLKPEGWIYAECPYYDSIWAWGDPTHTRAISEHALIFFMQNAYRVSDSMISPYRIHCDFAWLGMGGMEKGWALVHDPNDPKHRAIRFALKAVKPLQPWWEQ